MKTQSPYSKNRRTLLKRAAGPSILTTINGIMPLTVKVKTCRHPKKPLFLLCKPYLQNPTPTSVTVQWINNTAARSWVEFGETTRLGNKAQSVSNGLIDYNTVNSITLHSLKPNTKYYYRVHSALVNNTSSPASFSGKIMASAIKNFRTPKRQPQSFTMLIMNDLGEVPDSIPYLMRLNKSSFDQVFFNGGTGIGQGEKDTFIKSFLNPCAENFAGEFPFIFTGGSSDKLSSYRQKASHYFTNPGGNSYFSFTTGPVHFIVLDSGGSKPDHHSAYFGQTKFDAFREEEAQWLEREMQTGAYKKAKYRIVLMHIPPFYSEEHGALHCRKLFAPLFDYYKVDLCIHGFTHRYGIRSEERRVGKV